MGRFGAGPGGLRADGSGFVGGLRIGRGINRLLIKADRIVMVQL